MAFVKVVRGLGLLQRSNKDERWNTTIAGEVQNWDPSEKLDRGEIKKTDRVAQLGIWAAVEAMENSGLDWEQCDPYRNGVVIGSGVGGIQTIEASSLLLADRGPKRLSPFTVPKLMVNACAGNVSIRFNLRGVNSAPATACATGGHALAEAYMFIATNQADFILAGGTEGAVSPRLLEFFHGYESIVNT